MGCFTTLLLSVMLAAVYVEAQQQRFSVAPHDISVLQGQTAVLSCAVQYRKGDVQWTKGGFSLGFNRTIPGFPRYSITSSQEGEFNLMITSVRLEDDDEYSCQVLPGGRDRPLMARATLSVLVPCEEPTILNYYNGSIVEVPYTQQTLNLVCEARNGKPAAEIEWYRNGRTRVTENISEVQESVPGSKLITTRSTLSISLSNYQRENGVEYRCQAKNSAVFGAAYSTHVKLSVLYPPGPPQLSGYNGQDIKVNESVTLTCVSEGGNPTGHITWYRNGTPQDWSFISSQSGDSSRAVNQHQINATAADNSAVYKCEVTSQGLPNSPPQTAEYTLSVKFPPAEVTMTGADEPIKERNSVTLTCVSAISNPQATILWYASSRRLRTEEYTETVSASLLGGFVTTSTYQIDVTAQDHNTVYTCQAKNSEFGNTVAATRTLSVLYPPNDPDINGYREGTPIRAGTEQRLDCIAVGGNPVADLKWYKGNRLISGASYGTMGNIAKSEIAINAEPSDNGAVYKCKARNSAMTSAKTVTTRLKVHFPPRAVTITASPSQARVGQQVDLTCLSSSSNPAAEITWTRDNRRMVGTSLGTVDAEFGGKNTTNRLRFPATSRDHNAVFGCRATNMALDESMHDAITLNVLFKPEFDVATLPNVVEMKKGERGSINLTANANPPNVTYRLYKSRRRIRELPPHFDFRHGILNISRVEKSDKGDYMIKATNAEGFTTFNFSVIVKYPATISRVSTQQSIDEGESVVFVCVADAYPVVPNMFTWFREGFDLSRFRTKQEGNMSTLTIKHLRREDTGEFTCTVDNRIGSPTSGNVGLIVKFSPVIDKSPERSRSAGQTGTDVTLRCSAAGAPDVEIIWTRTNTQVRTGEKFEVSSTQSGATFESQLKVRAVTRDDYGAYVCTATNTKGSDSHSVTLAGTSKPYSPYNIQFVNSTARSITIAWKAGFNGGLAQSFRVRYKPVDARGYVYVDARPFGALSHKITGLEMDTRYEFTVLAFNDLGESAYQAQGITARTLEKEVPADVATSELSGSDETPVIIILVVCIVGVFILTLNVGLILFFIRKRKKRLEGTSDTTSHTNTFELYGSANKADNNMYPPPPSDDTRSYGTYDKSLDDFSDDYIRDYDRECETHVFLPPPQSDYPACRPYSPSQKLPPADSPRLLGGGNKMTTYDPRTGRVSPWTEDPYRRAQPRKGSYENGIPNGDVYEFKSARGQGMNELSDRPPSRPSSRTGSSSVLSPNIVAKPHYSSFGGSNNGGGGSNFYTSNNSITSPMEPQYNGSGNTRPSPHNTVPAGSEFRGHLV